MYLKLLTDIGNAFLARAASLPVFSLSSFLVEKMAMQKHMFEPVSFLS